MLNQLHLSPQVSIPVKTLIFEVFCISFEKCDIFNLALFHEKVTEGRLILQGGNRLYQALEQQTLFMIDIKKACFRRKTFRQYPSWSFWNANSHLFSLELFQGFGSFVPRSARSNIMWAGRENQGWYYERWQEKRRQRSFAFLAVEQYQVTSPRPKLSKLTRQFSCSPKSHLVLMEGCTKKGLQTFPVKIITPIFSFINMIN